jgi:hypothetical protein
MGLRSGLCAGHSSSSKLILTKHFCMNLKLLHRNVYHVIVCCSVKISFHWNCSPGIRQTQIRLSDCQMVECDSSLQRTRFHCSRVQWWQALHHSSLRLALHTVILGLCAAARPWKPISWSSRQNSSCAEAVWNSVMSFASEDRRFLQAMRFSTRRSCSVSLCGLPLRSWAVVAPRSFHFTITALTVDQGVSSRAEIWQTDFLESWYLMKISNWCSRNSRIH